MWWLANIQYQGWWPFEILRSLVFNCSQTGLLYVQCLERNILIERFFQLRYEPLNYSMIFALKKMTCFQMNLEEEFQLVWLLLKWKELFWNRNISCLAVLKWLIFLHTPKLLIQKQETHASCFFLTAGSRHTEIISNFISFSQIQLYLDYFILLMFC